MAGHDDSDEEAGSSGHEADQKEERDGKSGADRKAGSGEDDRENGKGDKDNESKHKSDDDDESDDDDKPPLYKRKIFWIVVVIVAAVLIVGGTLYWLHARKYQSTDDAFIDAHIVRISAETSGRLRQVANLDNHHIRKGQLLAVIEPGTTAATRQQALAAVAEADAQIEQARAQVAVAQASLQQARANARVPAAEEARATADYARYRNLRVLDPLAAAPTQLGQAQAQAQAARAQTQAAREQIDTAAANVAAARRQIDAAQARRRAAQAQVAQANVTVAYTTIRAPIDGQLVQRQVNLGSYVSPGQQLMAIVPDDMWVTANFKETQLTHMRPGQPVTFTVDAYPDVEFAGFVDSIQRGAGQAFQLLPPQNATGNYVKVVQRVPVRIRFREAYNAHYVLGPGMSVVPTVKVRP